jgi:NAD(P) transhydrogenase subunit beta
MMNKLLIILNFSTSLILSDGVYYILCVLLSLNVLLGIHLMSRVKTAKLGNRLSALAIALGIVITLVKKDIIPVWAIYPGMAVGLLIGLRVASKVKMIEMPQLVALLNGLGGAASAIVAAFAFLTLKGDGDIFGRITSVVAVAVGVVTLSGSLVAAGKLHKVLTQKPVILRNHQLYSTLLLIILVLLTIMGTFWQDIGGIIFIISIVLVSAAFGFIFAIRVGGADMPITISLLNSLSGVAAAIAGFAVIDILLVSIGGIVGASGLFLTRIMCRAMNRSLADILLGKTALQSNEKAISSEPGITGAVEADQDSDAITEKPDDPGKEVDVTGLINNAKEIIIVPGYGMALAQAQHLVKQLAVKLKNKGANVRYAIHPVAGRMPGHMDVLLIEAGVPFDDVYEMDDINDDFKDVDLTIVIGANDVLNPAARDAEGTPIYGMPILNVDQCSNILIFNYDLQPGYSGVENPLYLKKDGVAVIQGDASVTLADLLKNLN